MTTTATTMRTRSSRTSAWRRPKKFEEADIRAALEKLEDERTYGPILRAKGILPLTDGTLAAL